MSAWKAVSSVCLTLCVIAAVPAAPLTDAQKVHIDALVADILKSSGVPSASIAIVTDGKLDYARAYGDQRLDGSAATLSARYPVASISKQFTAAALLLLAEDGKLSLDDKVAKFLPALTGADKVTLRQLLSHTSGYRDYWPQDFAFADMFKPVSPQRIIDRWAKAPLDFEPGTQWQYSNTGYVVAGMIIESVAREPLFAFEKRRIFDVLGMHVVRAETDLSPLDARGADRFALGRLHEVPALGQGWGFAAGDLAMAPAELAKWNVARLNRSVLKAASWAQQETNVAPADSGVSYGLGVNVDALPAHSRIRHNGAWMGYLSTNRVFPDDRAAISVLINAGFSNSQDAIAEGIQTVLFGGEDDIVKVGALYASFREGRVDAARLTENGRYYFTPAALKDYQTSLTPLGTPKLIARVGKNGLRGGLTVQRYVFTFADRKLLIVLRAEPDTGLVEQFAVYPFSD